MLFDRDGTLVFDVPYNTDPDRVRPMPGAGAALQRLREHGFRCGVVTNQSGIGRGLITPAQAAAVNRRVAELLGPFEVFLTCPHPPGDGCRCRKPKPGLVLDACELLGVAPAQTVVVGDIGADLGAASAAGATGILVPTPDTRRHEVALAAHLAGSLAEVADLLCGASSISGRWSR